MEMKTFYNHLGQDYESVLKRMMGNEAFLRSLLNRFAADTTMETLEAAVHSHKAEDIFSQAHTLKGVAENLGLKPLYERVSVLVELTRKGSIENADEADKAFAQVKQAYGEVMDLLKTAASEQ